MWPFQPKHQNSDIQKNKERRTAERRSRQRSETRDKASDRRKAERRANARKAVSAGQNICVIIYIEDSKKRTSGVAWDVSQKGIGIIAKADPDIDFNTIVRLEITTGLDSDRVEAKAKLVWKGIIQGRYFAGFEFYDQQLPADCSLIRLSQGST
jgi:hypothetical protein